ncbi:MAG: YtxH domain-containing protein [Candidatus Hydrogenedentota bacterium]|nr:MAG: YtxH domain-containing protein [Candidatus Hydrogenedentota bacterium]
MSRSCDDGGMNALLAFLLGGVVGALFGILYAPSSGEEMRRRLRFYAEEAADRAVDRVSAVRENASERLARVKQEVEEVKDRFASAVDAGKKAFESETEAVEEKA